LTCGARPPTALAKSGRRGAETLDVFVAQRIDEMLCDYANTTGARWRRPWRLGLPRWRLLNIGPTPRNGATSARPRRRRVRARTRELDILGKTFKFLWNFLVERKSRWSGWKLQGTSHRWRSLQEDAWPQPSPRSDIAVSRWRKEKNSGRRNIERERNSNAFPFS
jgi:hypothetical protein